MTNRSNGRKKSLFPTNTTVPAGVYFDFFSNGINYKILDSDLYASFGVTGTLSQVGNPTSAPVLDKQGTDNFIRNLESGSGAKASLSAQNGIRLDHNFDFPTTPGTSITPDSTVTKPVMRPFVAGTGMNITASATQILFSATGSVTPTNIVIINAEVDFPTQTATIITLESNKIYQIGAEFSTAKRFIYEDGVVITMDNQFGNVLTYTGTGDMFSGSGASITIEKIRLSSPNANQTFSGVDTTGTKLFIVRSCTVVSTPKWGTFTGFQATIMNSCDAENADQGMTIAGSGQLITNVSQFALVSTSATFVGIDFGTAVIPNIELTDFICVAPAGAIGVKGAAANANVPSGSNATLIDSSFAGGMTAELSGITADDFRWLFSGNTGIPDTRPDGLISIVGNATETVIAASSSDGSNAVLMAGTWTLEGDSHFTSTTAGRMTYNGEVDFRAPIDFTTTILMASGGDKQVKVYLCINGTIVVQTGKQGTSSSTKAASITGIWQHTFQTNDYVEVWLENTADTVNIIGQQAVSRVN